MTPVLVDSSVWIGHFRKTDARLAEILNAKGVVTHSVVIGELAMGALARRGEVLPALRLLRRLPDAQSEEVLAFVESAKLWGRGLSWADAHLLAACRLSGASLWSHDRALHEAALALAVGFEER